MYVLPQTPPATDFIPEPTTAHYSARAISTDSNKQHNSLRSSVVPESVHPSSQGNQEEKDYDAAAAAEPVRNNSATHLQDSDDTLSDTSDVSDVDKKEKLVSFLTENGIPVSSAVIELQQLGKGLPLQIRILEILKELLPKSWGYIEDPADIKLDRVSGAMTNCVFFVTGPALPDGASAKPPKILLRVYGSGASQFITRDREMYWLCRMSDAGVAPKLLGAFANGRFEQFLDSTTLTKSDIRQPQTSAQIACALYKLHQLIHVCPDEFEATHSDLWNKLHRWQRIAAKAAYELKKSHPERYAILRAIVDIKRMPEEIQQLREELKRVSSPLVFAHNDAQYGNILLKTKDQSIVIVDYEYSSINYRGYDIANHFCEWAADYHSSTPHRMDFTKYPTKVEQYHFFNAYLDAAADELPNETGREKMLKSMYKEVNKFALASHLLWGLWGLMQANQTDIDFDYVGYALERFREYWRIKQTVLAL